MGTYKGTLWYVWWPPVTIQFRHSHLMPTDLSNLPMPSVIPLCMLELNTGKGHRVINAMPFAIIIIHAVHMGMYILHRACYQDLVLAQ